MVASGRRIHLNCWLVGEGPPYIGTQLKKGSLTLIVSGRRSPLVSLSLIFSWRRTSLVWYSVREEYSYIGSQWKMEPLDWYSVGEQFPYTVG